MEDHGHTDHPVQGSQLFMLRIWLEDLGDGQSDWQGKVMHVSSGEARFFRGWEMLETFVEDLLGEKPSG